MRLTSDPDLHLVIDGVRIDPLTVSEQRYVFRLDLPSNDVRLLSRTMRPSEIEGSTDTRLLGFAVSGLRLQQGDWKFDIGVDEPELIDGFYGFEDGGWRWTNGNAALPHGMLSVVQGSFLFVVFGWGAVQYSVPENDREGDEQLMLQFESLGEDCEFGFVQRHYGAEPMGLLRWANIGFTALQTCLDQGFEGLGEPSNTELVWSEDEPEYVLVDRTSLKAHTWISRRCADPGEEAKIKRYGCIQLRLLRRKLLTDIRHGRKIMVFKSTDPQFGRREQERMHRSLQKIGPSSLLCVSLAADGDRVGQVEDRGDGLLVGSVDRFTLSTGPYHAWRSLCLQACSLHWRWLQSANMAEEILA